MKLHLHPDGIVYIRNVDESSIYEASLAEFAVDNGAPFPALSNVVREVRYDADTGIGHLIDRRGNTLDDKAQSWEFGEDILRRAAALASAKAARLIPPRPTAEQIAESQRKATIDQNIAGATLGNAQPATLAQLKRMTLAEYAAWFDANFTTTAQLIGLLKRIVLVLIRRVL